MKLCFLFAPYSIQIIRALSCLFHVFRCSLALLTVKEVIGEEEEEEEEEEEGEKVDVTLEEKTPLEVVAEGKQHRPISSLQVPMSGG